MQAIRTSSLENHCRVSESARNAHRVIPVSRNGCDQLVLGTLRIYLLDVMRLYVSPQTGHLHHTTSFGEQKSSWHPARAELAQGPAVALCRPNPLHPGFTGVCLAFQHSKGLQGLRRCNHDRRGQLDNTAGRAPSS